MGEDGGVIRCEPYDGQWPLEFERIARFLARALGESALAIEHVGSTAVPGLCAKPIIDIIVVFDSCADFPQVRRRLEAAGFIHEGDLGIAAREAFKRAAPDEFMAYHLYACPRDSGELLDQLSFRDHLRRNDDDRRAYGDLKEALTRRYARDRQAYTQAKGPFIRDVYRRIREAGQRIERYPFKGR